MRSRSPAAPPLDDVTVAALPPGSDGYTILHLSDLHISSLFPAAWARAVVARANALGTDVIAVTGAFIDGSLAARRDDVAPLRNPRARDGVWEVPGNHKYVFDFESWMEHLAGLGIRILANAHTIL